MFNPVLYPRRPSPDEMANHTVNNDDRWIKFFSQQRRDADFAAMARRLAPAQQPNVVAIRNKFNSISGRLRGGELQSYRQELEGSTEFSREIYELRLVMAGRQIPHANHPNSAQNVDFPSISAIKEDIGETVQEIEEILNFFRNGNRQNRRYDAIEQARFNALEHRWNTQVRDDRWMNMFMLRATRDPGSAQNQNQDDYVLRVFDLVEAYNEIDSSYPDYNERVNNRYRRQLSQFYREISQFKTDGDAPNPPMGPRRRKRRRVDYYYY